MYQAELFNSKKRVHVNSIKSFQSSRKDIGKRARMVLDYLRRHNPSTDRQVMHGLGFTDCNSVRPRITELLQLGILTEVDSVIDEVTKKRVRRVTAL